jgi:hypothetical protein
MTMTVTMPRVLRESRAGRSLAKVLIGQDRAKNAEFWRQVICLRILISVPRETISYAPIL